ncbi:MAG TPA: hypothetical protein VII43_05115 [Opitutaceae bacterium]
MRPNTSPASPLTHALAAAGLVLASLGAGCQHERVDQLTQAVESGERPVAMAGSEPFFGGKVTARVTVSRGIGHGFKRKGATFLNGPSGFGVTEANKEQDQANDEEARQAYVEYMKTRPTNGTPLPPVTLHLIVINTGAEPVTIGIIDFNSDLGNFVVDPDTVTVAPGDSADATPMVSKLGVSSPEIPVTVTLRLGAAKETRVVYVKDLLDDSGKPKAQP